MLEGVLSKVDTGCVLSIFTVTILLEALVLPALSVAVCAVDDIELPSVLSIWSAGQLAMPEPASEQIKCTVTLDVYQPFEPMVPALTAAKTVGAVTSLVAVFEPVPRFPAESFCNAVAVKVPSARELRSRVLVQALPVQIGAGEAVTLPTANVMAKLVSQTPERATEVLFVLLTVGKAVTVTTGAVVSKTVDESGMTDSSPSS